MSDPIKYVTSNKRKRSMDDRYCSGCKLGPIGDAFEATPLTHFMTINCPMSHILCIKCYMIYVVASGQPLGYCSLCRTIGDTVDVTTPQVEAGIATTEDRHHEPTTECTIQIDLEHATNANPLHRHAAMGPITKNSFITMTTSVAVVGDDDKEVESISADLRINGEGGGGVASWGDDAKDSLERCFQVLNSCFFGDRTKEKEDKNAAVARYAAAGAVSLDTLANNDKSMLHRCIYALTTGARLRDSFKEQQKIVNATYASCELLRRRVGADLHSLVDYTFMTNAASKSLVQFFNQMGMSSSMSTIRLKNARAKASFKANATTNDTADVEVRPVKKPKI